MEFNWSDFDWSSLDWSEGMQDTLSQHAEQRPFAASWQTLDPLAALPPAAGYVICNTLRLPDRDNAANGHCAPPSSLTLSTFDARQVPTFAALGVGTHQVGELQRAPSDQSGPRISCPVPGCDETFTRKDSVKKHLASKKHSLNTQVYACLLCPKSFARNDHLTQHLCQYHRVSNGTSTGNAVYCFHHGCHGGTGMMFISNAELHKHIRRIHKQTPFECPVDGCDRKGPKGWFRRNDRVLHQRKYHADIDAAQLAGVNEAIDAMIPDYLARLV